MKVRSHFNGLEDQNSIKVIEKVLICLYYTALLCQDKLVLALFDLDPV